MPCFLSMLLSNQGPFPRPALPGVISTTGPSATSTTRPDPRGLPVGPCPTIDEASHVASSPIFHACRHHYPGGSGTVLTRLASRSPSAFPCLTEGRLPRLLFRGLPSARLRFGPRGRWTAHAALCHQSASVHFVTSVEPLWLLPTGALAVGRDSHPPGKSAFPWHTLN